MLFKIGDQTFNTNEIPCALVMVNDEERERLISILQSMQPKPGEPRWLSCHPGAMSKEELDKWSELTEEDWAKMTTVVNTSLKYEL